MKITESASNTNTLPRNRKMLDHLPIGNYSKEEEQETH